MLVGAGAFQLLTGLLNIGELYPWGLFFTTTHYRSGWIAIGAVAVHVGAKAPEIRRGLARPGSPGASAGLTREQAAELAAVDDAAEGSAVPRRAFVLATGLGVGALTVATVGQSLSPLGQVSALAPRVPGVGPQALPVRKTANGAGVTDVGSDYRLAVDGPHRLELSLDDLLAFPQRTERLPITCVEGWSASAEWTGVRLSDLLDEAGLPRDTEVTVESLQKSGLYRLSTVAPPHAQPADPAGHDAQRRALAAGPRVPAAAHRAQPARRHADQVGDPGESDMRLSDEGSRGTDHRAVGRVPDDPYASDPARPATSALRSWWRWAFVLPGLAAVGYGGYGLLTGGSRIPLSSWAAWFVGSALLHDLVIAPVWIALGWLAARTLPTVARPAVVVGAAVAGFLTLVSLPFVLAPGADPANPSSLPWAYGRNLLLLDAVIVVLAAGWALVAHRLASRRATRR